MREWLENPFEKIRNYVSVKTKLNRHKGRLEGGEGTGQGKAQVMRFAQLRACVPLLGFGTFFGEAARFRPHSTHTHAPCTSRRRALWP